jgi:hypothetical protein
MKSTLLRSAPAAGLVAIALIVSAGSGAVAAGLITGAQIKDGTVTTADVKDHTLKVRDFAATTKAQLKGAKGDQGIQGIQGVPGAVRAYGLVSKAGSLSRAAAGVAVSHPSTGVYCIAVTGVSGADTVAVVTADYAHDDTFSGSNQTQAFIEYNSGAVCPAATDVVIRTYARSFDGTTHDTTLALTDEGFSFLIP